MVSNNFSYISSLVLKIFLLPKPHFPLALISHPLSLKDGTTISLENSLFIWNNGRGYFICTNDKWQGLKFGLQGPWNQQGWIHPACEFGHPNQARTLWSVFSLDWPNASYHRPQFLYGVRVFYRSPSQQRKPKLEWLALFHQSEARGAYLLSPLPSW